MDQHQENAFVALQKLDEIFHKHNIEYVLLAGTVLGAVRHKGFIPWDDDIDVGIFLKDKERAYEALASEIQAPFQWADRSVHPKFPRLYGKILCESIGCVDVFLLVKTSDNLLERRKQWNRRKFLFKLYKAKIKYANKNELKNPIKRAQVLVMRFFSIFFTPDKIEAEINKNESCFEHLEQTQYYLNMYGAYSLERELIQSNWLKNFSNVCFEGKEFPTVSDTHAFLTHLYGDYMTPPKESERTVRHGESFL